MRRVLPPLLTTALLLIVASACGSQTKTASTKGLGVDTQLLALAVTHANSLGDSDPSLIGMTSSGRSASILLGVHGLCGRGARLVKCGGTNTSYVRYFVDSKTKKPSLLSPVEAPVVRGGSKAERALMLQIARGIDMESPTRIKIKKAGRSFHPHSPNAVIVTFHASTLESEWRAGLAAALFQRFADVQVVAYGYIGATNRIGGVPGAAATPANVGSPVSFPKELALARRLISMVQGDGAHVVSLTLARPVGLAVSVTIQTDQPARYLKHDLEAVLSSLRRRALAGSFVRVIDRRGEKVLEAGTTSYEGSVWVRHSLEGCSPIMTLGLGGKQKPCPVK
jgi:hypothetical protein